MANIPTGQYNFGQINTPKIADITSIYAQVGQQLNKQYYENRQAHINNIVNPLSQMKANKDDEQLLNQKRNNLLEGAEEFKKEDNWHRAGDYIFNTVESIISDKALNLINQKYAQRQNYLQGLSESGWDSNMQNYFIRASDLQSESVVEDADGNVTGGFYGINYGEPFDIGAEYKRISDIAAKVKADGQEITSISAEDAVVQGLANIIGIDGETFVSNFLKTTSASEGVSYDKLFNFAYQQLSSNPQFISYMKTVSDAELFNKRFIADPTNPRGGELSPLNPQLLADIFPQSYTLNALVGAGIKLSDLGALNENGTFTLNPNMSQNTINKLTQISAVTGFDIVSYLEKGASSNLNIDIDTLDEFLNVSFDANIDSMFEDYLKNNNISPNDDNIEFYKEQWYSNLYTQNKIQSTIHSQADSIANLMSWNKTKIAQDLISNQSAYSTAYKRKMDRSGKYQEEIQSGNYTTASALPDVTVDASSTRVIQNRLIEAGEVMTRAEKESAGIVLNDRTYNILGNAFGIEKGDIDAVMKLDFDKILNSDIYLPDEEKEKIHQLQRYQSVIKDAQGEIDRTKLEFNKAYDIIKENTTGLFRGETKELIINNNLTTYEDYVQFLNKENARRREEYGSLYLETEHNPYNVEDVEDYTGVIDRLNRGGLSTALKEFSHSNYGVPVTREQFNRMQQEIADKASEIYLKKTGESLKYTSKATIVYNPSEFTQSYVNNAIANIETDAGDWVLEDIQGTKKFKDNIGLSVANNEKLKKLLVTYSPRSSSGTISNLEELGFKAKESGLPEDTHSVEYHPVFDSNSIALDGQRKFKIEAVFKNANGAPVGKAIISRNISEGAYNDMQQQEFNKIRTYQLNDPNLTGESILNESLGNIVSQSTQSIFKFNSIPNENSISANNSLDLEVKLRNVKAGDKVYTQTNIEIPFTNPMTGQPMKIDINPYIELEKVALGNGEFGFKATMVRPDGNGKWIKAPGFNINTNSINPILGNALQGLANYQMNGNTYKSVTDALGSLTFNIMDAKYKLNSYGY